MRARAAAPRGESACGSVFWGGRELSWGETGVWVTCCLISRWKIGEHTELLTRMESLPVRTKAKEGSPKRAASKRRDEAGALRLASSMLPGDGGLFIRCPNFEGTH